MEVCILITNNNNNSLSPPGCSSVSVVRPSGSPACRIVNQ